MNRIKLLLIAEATVGGIKEHLQQILNHLDRDRFEISFIYSAEREPGFVAVAERYCAEGIAAIQVPMVRPIRLLTDYRCYRKILWNLRLAEYDVIHTHGTKGGVLGRFAARHAAGKPKVVHTGHTFPIQWAKGFSRRFVAAVERHAMVHTDRLIALTNAQKNLLVAEGICGEEKIEIIPNAVDAGSVPGPERKRKARQELAVPPDCPVVGMAGRAVHQKNPIFFVHTAHRVLSRVQDARFVWIGDGPLHAEMERAAESLGFADRLLVTGTREDVRELYAAFDVFLMTSRYEGLPYAVLEAMAAQVPVVSVNLPGMDEVVEDGVNGSLAPPDADALAAEVVELLENDSLRETLGRNAREHVRRKHSIQDSIAKIEAVYSDIVTANERK